MTALNPARIAGGLVLVFAALGTGCGKVGKETGTVVGKASYKGAPLAAGNLNFLSKTGSAAIAKVGAGGAFQVDGKLEAGEYKVYATAPQPEPQAPGAKASGPPKFELPPKFRDPASSGVTVVVKAGENDISVEFKD